MKDSLAEDFLADALSTFRDYKKLAERAFVQISDEELLLSLDAEANSVAVIIKHMSGNMLSRWTDFLTTDGEKPNRQRDLEFVLAPRTGRDEILQMWERGWACLFAALEPLTPADFQRKVLIRGEDHSVMQAITRQLTHYGYHIGQIVFLCKHFRAEKWQSLSIPRNRSAEFNAFLSERQPQGQERQSRFDAPQQFISETETKD